jgi:hypothetical protein
MGQWHMVNPLRLESMFHIMSEILASMCQPLLTKGTDGVSLELVQLYRLNES